VQGVRGSHCKKILRKTQLNKQKKLIFLVFLKAKPFE